MAGIPRHINDGDIDTDPCDILRDGTQKQEESREHPNWEPHVVIVPVSTSAIQISKEELNKQAHLILIPQGN